MRQILQLILALLFGAMASQIPAFYDQYTQRLGGALDELDGQVRALDERAAAQGMVRYDYLRRLLDNPDDAAQGEGEALLAMVARQQWLMEVRDEIAEDRAYLKGVKLLLWLDTTLAMATLKDFVPALPLSFSGAGHFLVGFMFGYLLPYMIMPFLPRRRRADA